MSFKILTHNSSFVDESKLHEGIYTTSVPDLHVKSMTIKKLIDLRKHLLRLEEDDIACQNIRKCELTEVDLTMKP